MATISITIELTPQQANLLISSSLERVFNNAAKVIAPIARLGISRATDEAHSFMADYRAGHFETYTEVEAKIKDALFKATTTGKGTDEMTRAQEFVGKLLDHELIDQNEESRRMQRGIAKEVENQHAEHGTKLHEAVEAVVDIRELLKSIHSIMITDSPNFESGG